MVQALCVGEVLVLVCWTGVAGGGVCCLVTVGCVLGGHGVAVWSGGWVGGRAVWAEEGGGGVGALGWVLSWASVGPAGWGASVQGFPRWWGIPGHVGALVVVVVGYCVCALGQSWLSLPCRGDVRCVLLRGCCREGWLPGGGQQCKCLQPWCWLGSSVCVCVRGACGVGCVAGPWGGR